MKALIENDQEAIRTKLQTFIDRLDPEKHRQDLVNISIGVYGTTAVNVHYGCQKGFKQMCKFREKLPDGFLETIHQTPIIIVPKRNM